jgi:pimeloyl-ACP methyl ester carboxylesterase
MLEEPELREFAESTLLRIRALKRMGMGAIRPQRTLSEAQDGVVDDTGYWVVPADSDTTVIAFTGRAMRLDISIYFMQRILKRFGVNVIYVFDWADAYYFAGVKGLGTNTRRTAARLRGLCAELGTKRLVCFGQSSGGYAAIRYGAKLKADGVLAFSPVILSVMKPHILDAIERATGRRPPRRRLDLRRILGRRRRIPYTKIVYGDGNPADVKSARYVSHLDNVAEHVLPGVSNHGTVEVTTLTGEFPRIFRMFCDEVGVGRWAKRRRRATSGRRSPGSRARVAR